jgi:glucose 1-dehydrogenase
MARQLIGAIETAKGSRMSSVIYPRLKGRNAIVTGAGSGIGRAVAVRFAAEGASVAINVLDSDSKALETLSLARSAAATHGHSNTEHFLVQADISSEGDVSKLFAIVDERFPRLDILVNNAGIVRESPSNAWSRADYAKTLAVNLTGAAVCAEAAIKRFQKSGGGTIINCSSVHEVIPKPNFLAYSISKGGLGNLTRTLALEFARSKIRVNAVAPGAIDTPMNDSWRNDPKARAAVEDHIPMGRSGTPEEMAAVFAFLASDDAAYITGQTIYACGGLTLFGDFRTNWST